MAAWILASSAGSRSAGATTTGYRSRSPGANDINESACNTYRLNLQHAIKSGDMAEIMDTLPKSADVVTGGFPCQDVSINGARSVEDGERTVLYQRMIEVIRAVKPNAFVAENVKGLLMSHGRMFFDRMLADFEIPSYRVSHRLYLAADYGVPQMRERIFIVGVKGRREFRHPKPSSKPMTAREALADLEDAPENSKTAHIWSRAQRSPEQGQPSSRRRQAVDDDPRRASRQHPMALQPWPPHLATGSGATAILSRRLPVPGGDARNRAADWQRGAAGASVAHRQSRTRTP